MTLDIATQGENVFSLNPEHEIIKRYLEYGGWKKAGIRVPVGKRVVLKVLQYHMQHCSFEANSEHELIRDYLECRNWNKLGIHHQTGIRTIQKVLRAHMVHCLQIMQEKETIQKLLWKCPVCGKEMMITPYWAKRRKYCSYQCYSSVPRKRKPMSESRKFRMSPNWRRARKKRISKFGNICPISLKKEPLDVHHIDLDWSNNDSENLIPLWRPLHRLITARANYDEFLEARDRAILSSITKAWKE